MFVPEIDSSYKFWALKVKVSDEDVKKAYRKMAMKYHPDKVGHLGEDYKKMPKRSSKR